MTTHDAEPLTEALEWGDLALDAEARRQVEEIGTWIGHGAALLIGDIKLRRILAAHIGRDIGRPVYRIDLSKIVSKYVGETEKALGGIFEAAAQKDWVLFFDEADALFGKRTENPDANDRAVNEQIAYLLQRIDDYPWIVILAANSRSHLDEAFARRFQAVIRLVRPQTQDGA